jgi:hypothetical protein
MQFFILAAAAIALVGGVAVVRNYSMQRKLRVAGSVAVGTLVLLVLLFLAFINI